MSFTEAIGSGFQNAFNFRGRAGVGEFWKWILFYTLVNIVFEIVVDKKFVPQEVSTSTLKTRPLQ